MFAVTLESQYLNTVRREFEDKQACLEFLCAQANIMDYNIIVLYKGLTMHLSVDRDMVPPKDVSLISLCDKFHAADIDVALPVAEQLATLQEMVAYLAARRPQEKHHVYANIVDTPYDKVRIHTSLRKTLALHLEGLVLQHNCGE